MEAVVDIVTPVLDALQQKHPKRKPPKGFRKELEGVNRIFDSHAEFLAHYRSSPSDFVYDRTSGLYFVGVNGKHVDLMAKLYWYYGGHAVETHEAADQYVLYSFGMFRSRASANIYRGPECPVPGELFSIAREIKVMS